MRLAIRSSAAHVLRCLGLRASADFVCVSGSRASAGIGARFAASLMVAMALLLMVSASAFGRSEGSLLADPLVIPSMQPLDEGQQLREQEQAERSNPVAVAIRADSQSEYEHLDPQRAAGVTGEAFPELVDRSLGMPELPAGARVAGYESNDTARVTLPGGAHAVLQASYPLAVGAPGQRLAPLDLRLGAAGSGFEPLTAAVHVHLPKRLAEGARIAASGVKFTPVDAQGAPLDGSQGMDNGSSVLYANTATDSDTVLKPAPLGLEIDTVLRSAASPTRLFFRVGLPAQDHLAHAARGSDAVGIVSGSKLIAVVLPPSAQDAAGTSVPVSMAVVKGDLLAVSVSGDHSAYRYPISVDPTIVDKSPEFYKAEEPEAYYPVTGGNWKLTSNGTIKGYGYAYKSEKFEDSFFEGTLARGQYADLIYTTQGESKIKAFRADVTGTTSTAAGYLAIAGSSYEAGPVSIPLGPEWHELTAAGSNENSAVYETIGTAAESTGYVSRVYGTEVTIEQTNGPKVTMDTTEEVVNGEQNALYGGRWVSDYAGKWGFKASAYDPGMGISKEIWSSPNASKWSGEPSAGSPDRHPEYHCHSGIQCAWTWLPNSTLQGPSGGELLPEGEDTVELKVEDPVGLSASTGAYKVKIDNTRPYNVTLTGLPSNHEIDDGQHFLLKASASDSLSGVASITLAMDGQPIGSPAKGCTGACTTSGEWTLSGESYAAGKYTLEEIAIDKAGNQTVELFTVTIHHAGGVSAGPGSVNPITGELSLTTNDVAVNAPNGELSVSRGYRSRHLALGTEGPLGPQWILSLGGRESLTKTPTGGMILTGSNGAQTVFASAGSGKFTSPVGDASLTLSEKQVGTATDFLLADNGAVTTFALPSGSSGSVWTPAISEGAGGTNATTFMYRSEKGVIEPTEQLAPVPSGVSCSPKLAKGCRALTFEYDGKETTAKGEAPSEWGEYLGHLNKISYTAWNLTSKEMSTVVVAQYTYDKQGRLRAEWNPQIEPSPLKTVYGYDAEGHITAVSSPGQQPVLLEQGTIPGDGGTGRLMAVSRPAAVTTTELKEEMAQAPPANTGVPTLSSSTAKVGVKISVATNGSWSNKPLAYSYQWEDCNSSGKECTAIPGAVNQAYYPVAGDEGHTLVAEVFAINADGTVVAASAATSAVANGTPFTPLPEPPSVGTSSVSTLEYQVPLSGTGVPQMGSSEVAKWGQTDVPNEAMAILPPDAPMGWPAKEYTRAKIVYLDVKDRAVNVSTPAGGIATTEYNAYNDVKRTLSPDNQAKAMKESCESTEHCKSAELAGMLDTESTYEEGGSEPGTQLLSTLGPQHTIQLANKTQVEARIHTVYSYNGGAPAEGGPYHLVTQMTEGPIVAGKEEAAEVRTTKTSYSGQNNLGWKLHKPSTVTTDPSKLKLTHSMFYEPKTGSITEQRNPAAGAPGEEQGDVFSLQFGKLGSEKGQFKEPQGIAVSASGNEYVLDSGNNRVEEFNRKGEWVRTFGTTEPGKLSSPRSIALDSSGNVWVANAGSVIEYAGEGSYKAKMAEEEKPYGVTVDSEGNVWITRDGESSGFDEWAYNAKLHIYTLSNGVTAKGSGETQFKEPRGIALGAEGNVYVADTGNNRIDEWQLSKGSLKHVRNFGTEGSGNGQLKEPAGIATDSAGDVWVADAGNNRIEEFGPTGSYIQTFGKAETSKEETEEKEKRRTNEGKVKAPNGVAVDAEGNAWVADTGYNDAQEWTPNGTGYGAGTATAHNTQTIYYTAGPNSKVAACGEHAEWANLVCQTQPAAQPEGSLPKLASTTYTYNMWDEPETVTTTSEGTSRTVTDTYDKAGRIKTTSGSSTVGTSLPTVTNGYNAETGALETDSRGGKTIKSLYNTLGELVSYTDADENTATYEYDIDGRVKKINNGRGTEAFEYSKTTGLPTGLINEYGTSKLEFGGSYDAEGNLVSESYPNGMVATAGYSSVGKPVSLSYVKTTHCTEKCTWFSDEAVPSAHGQWMSQTSTLSKNEYTYDGAGRLTQVQDTPTGKNCVTRLYAYDADTNRTSLTTREPNAKGECASEGGAEAKHTYDQADRLNDTGVKYDVFGDITALPAADAGGTEPSEELTNTYYVDGQLASQTQSGQTNGYNLDPAGRTREVVSTGKRVEAVVNHYAGSEPAPAWTTNNTGEVTRNIRGLNGELAAIQYNGETPTLEITNLQGDVIATASLSATATELASKQDTTEFGVPTTNLPPKYSWLGGIELPTELSSGVVEMGARSYVPQLGRFLQPDPIPGGSANAYTYTFGDPVNTSDPSGDSSLLSLLAGHAGAVGAEALAREEAEIEARVASEEAAAREIAERAAEYAASVAAAASGGQWGGEEEGFEEEFYYEEEEEESEFAAFHPGGKPANQEPHLEDAVLYQPLGESMSTGQGEANLKDVARRCLKPSGAGHEEALRNGPGCMQYASFLHWLKKHVGGWAHALYHGAKSVVTRYWAAFSKFEPLPTPFELVGKDVSCKSTGVFLALSGLTDGAPLILRAGLTATGLVTTFEC